jgi:hypothetical protein
MTFWGSLYSNELFFILQGLFIIPVVYYALKDIRLYPRVSIDYLSFNQKSELFNPDYSGFFGFIRGLALIAFMLFSIIFLFVGAWVFSVILLVESLFLILTITLEETSIQYSLDLSKFRKAQNELSRFKNQLDEQLQSLQEVLDSISSDKASLSMIDREIITIHPELTVQENVIKIETIMDDINKTLEEMTLGFDNSIHAFNKAIGRYITLREDYELDFPTSFVLPSIKNEASYVRNLRNTSIQELDPKLFNLLEKTLFSAEQYHQLVNVFVRLELPIKQESIQLLIKKIPANPNLDATEIDEIVVSLYKNKWLEKEIILSSLEESLFFIINRGVFSHLSKQEIVDILQLLISQDSKEAMSRFLKNMPKDRFELLYVIPRINSNEAGQLALQFREFSPLKYEFTDESTKYYSMYQSLINAGHQFSFSKETPLGEMILKHSGIIASTYQEAFEQMEDLLSYIESIKLLLLTSEVQSSPVLRVSSAIELVYEYLVSLQRRPAEVLLQYIESVFLQAETNPALLEDFSKQYNEHHNSEESITHKNAAKFGRSLLRDLMTNDNQLLLAIIARVERERLAWDVLQEWVTV